VSEKKIGWQMMLEFSVFVVLEVVISYMTYIGGSVKDYCL